ncbi:MULTISPECIES: glycosyltransferase family 4 protein [unclassified Pseudomonas]|uniref:MraY family glycosyltransferase n=1 Tax=unclassified Pseudomonas TaxID=196821 RepID=UPI001F59D6D0|nr:MULTISPECIES: glycosyltransferase family 4 protein [unclassified Pseudomonas]
MKVWWLLIVVFICSWGMTFLLRRYALAANLMDVPNERSSHSIPTPRGGGVAIVASFLLILPVAASLGLLSSALLYSFLGAGLLIAIIGFADDHGHIAARWRLFGHFIAAGWALYWLNGFPPIDMFGVILNMGWTGDILALVYLVWMLNLYNFMDGIDGLASAEAISVCLGMCLIYWLCGVVDMIWPPLILAAAVAGFLWWNVPPARIFMGDAGSGFLGVVLGVIVLHATYSNPRFFWSWLLLLGVFVVDATWTLVRRLLAGEKVFQAHRSHGYQKAAARWGHLKVTCAVVILNIAVLLPISISVAMGKLDGLVSVVMTYLLLACLACWTRAGVK